MTQSFLSGENILVVRAEQLNFKGNVAWARICFCDACSQQVERTCFLNHLGTIFAWLASPDVLADDLTSSRPIKRIYTSVEAWSPGDRSLRIREDVEKPFAEWLLICIMAPFPYEPAGGVLRMSVSFWTI